MINYVRTRASRQWRTEYMFNPLFDQMRSLPPMGYAQRWFWGDEDVLCHHPLQNVLAEIKMDYYSYPDLEPYVREENERNDI